MIIREQKDKDLSLRKTADKLKQQDLATLNKIIDKVMPEVSTSFTTKEILSLATGAFDYELGETTGFPFDLETRNRYRDTVVHMSSRKDWKKM